MNQRSVDIQKTIDSIIDKVFLGFIPHSVKPNQVTVVRFIMTPIVYMLLIINKFDLALILFIIAASTDFIDGAMARTRNQITDVGKIIDPIADKFLILSILLYIGLDYLIVKVFIVVILFELIAIAYSAFFSYKAGRPIGANVFGKIKMILQSVSVGLFILAILAENNILINISEYFLFAALVFAILSGLKHLVDRAAKTFIG
jgi:CDP-diacylglycerol--glycerol-3-phosphate 3-phosphatidyltransferase